MNRREGARPRQIVIPEDLWQRLDAFGWEQGYSDARGFKSAIVRGIISAEMARWDYSPYICSAAKHTVVITSKGDLFHHQKQVLKLNSPCELIPCLWELRPLKRQHFLRNRAEHIDEIEYLRSKWLINYFAAWHGEDVGRSLLDATTDSQGTDQKMADLVINQGPGHRITREIMVGLEGYVEHQDAKPNFDFFEIPMDLPSRDLEIVAFVDAALYSNTHSIDEVPNLGVEFRNREFARFQIGVERDPENPLSVSVGRNTPGKRQRTEMMPELDLFVDRLGKIADAQIGGMPLLSKAQSKRLRDAFRRPDKFLSLRLAWQAPYTGLNLCVRWEMPPPFTT
jgi:hypothetical protein